MRYLVAAAAGLAGAVVGWIAAASLALVLAGLAGTSDFEGERGMFAAFAIGPLGGVAGMIAGAWAALRGSPGGATVGRLGLVVASIAGVVAAGIGIRLATIDTYENEAPPTLLFEIRLPDALALADRDQVRIEVDTDRSVDEASLADPWSRREAGGQVVAGWASLTRKTSSRLVVVRLPGAPARLFRLDLARDPGTSAAYGEWRRPDFVDDGHGDAPVPAPDDDPVRLRVRVRRAGDD